MEGATRQTTAVTADTGADRAKTTRAKTGKIENTAVTAAVTTARTNNTGATSKGSALRNLLAKFARLCLYFGGTPNDLMTIISEEEPRKRKPKKKNKTRDLLTKLRPWRKKDL